jgi:hypothetical protein
MDSKDSGPEMCDEVLEVREPKSRLTTLRLRNSDEGQRPPARLDYQIPVMQGLSKKARGRQAANDFSDGGFSFTTESFHLPEHAISVKVCFGRASEPLQVFIRIVRVPLGDESASQFYGVFCLCPPDAVLSN